MCLVKKFPAYLNATQFRTTIENLRNQINKVSADIFFINIKLNINALNDY